MITEFCENPNILRIISFIESVFNIILFIIPMIVIIMISADFLKNVIENDESKMKKNLSIAIKRIIFVIIIFLLPIFIDTTLKIVDPKSNTQLKKCMDNSNISKIEELQAIYDAKKETNNISTKPNSIQTEKKKKIISKKQQENDQKEFLKAAKKVWKKIVSGNRYFTYNHDIYNNIPITNSYCDCSSYVSWALYEYGYTDFKGKQKKTWHFYNTNWKKKYGWTIIKVKAGENVTSKLKAGDILVRVPINKDGTAGSGHIDVIASVKKEKGKTKIDAYDCGNDSYIKNGQNPNGVSAPDFFIRGGNPGKIIRVTSPK